MVHVHYPQHLTEEEEILVKKYAKLRKKVGGLNGFRLNNGPFAKYQLSDGSPLVSSSFHRRKCKIPSKFFKSMIRGLRRINK
jgi:hypothetical protein